jgi:hypothetical protein
MPCAHCWHNLEPSFDPVSGKTCYHLEFQVCCICGDTKP